ncbi:hypothetical protein MYAM1_002819 [Malassezia yamatoensis]|uniref:Large ribosomal subunit protein uL3m n=1 Tax=Malassezia yamatoensis TaxID=253288 RepID=A0AAJ5YYV0_9BASI|nr:hypothetical protein MYAM1_002819 [Malassezia yamatoensis]
MLRGQVWNLARVWRGSLLRVGREQFSTSARCMETELETQWTPLSRRVGLITRKMGMTTMFTPDGKKVPATVLYVDANRIAMHVGLREHEEDDHESYTAMQVAAVYTKRQSKAQEGHLANAGIRDPKQVLREFRVSRDALLPLGTELSAAHFVPGQDVDVRAITRGKGFQGVMKRHGFKGGNATHGASLAHRKPGSIGQNQDPGRVFPGKKMPGRMGGTAHRTVQNARVLRIDTKNELIYVKGAVPGPEGGVVYVQDALKNLVKSAYYTFRKGKTSAGELIDPANGVQQYLSNGVQDLPFPAGTKQLAAKLPEIVEVGPSS